MSILFLFLIPTIIVVALFVRFLVTGKNAFDASGAIVICELFCIVIGPFVFLLFFDVGQKNDCCSDSAVFSPEHRLSAYVFILLSTAAFTYSKFRSRVGSPILEVVNNSLLVGGIVLNVFLSIHLDDYLWLIGNLPIIILFLMMLLKNHFLVLDTLNSDITKASRLQTMAIRLLKLKLFQKLPVFLVICFPLLLIVAAFLILFGQKPDSILRAFTDTYKHGFSELDYQCVGVVCEGHYLCTVAAKGHRSFVNPIRKGVRGGKQIVCNRQLLISNAFEELIEKRIPSIHRPIRKFYDKLGSFVEKYYYLFNCKFVSDSIYILMKPLEWMFVITLYIFYRNPENHIASQYLSDEHRNELKKHI